MLESKELITLGKRVENLNDFVKEPKDQWIINDIIPKFEQMLKTGFDESLEPKGIRILNDSINAYQMRFNKVFEQKINIKNRLLIREAIINLLEEDTKFSEGDAVNTKEGDKGVITFGKHPFYAVKLDSTGTTHSYHFSDLEIDPTASPEGMDFGKYDTTEPEQQEPELKEIKVNKPIELPRPKSGESLKDFVKRIKLEAGFRTGLLYIDKNTNGYSSKLTTNYFPNLPTEEIRDKDIFLKSLIMLFQTRFKDKIQLKYIKNTGRGYGGPNGSYTIRLVTKVHPKDLILSEPNPIQESAPQDIVHLDGLLTVNDNLNVTDVMSDIRSITGITIVKPIDIPGESHKNKVRIKIDPFPFSNKDPEFIKQQIKTQIRKIPGVKEFWSGTITDNLSERKYKIKDPK